MNKNKKDEEKYLHDKKKIRKEIFLNMQKKKICTNK